MSKKSDIVKHQSTQVVLSQSQNLLDITNSILKNSKRDIVEKNSTQIITVDDNFVLIKAGSFMMGSDEYDDE